MEEKVIKFEIGKVLAVVVSVIAITALAGVALQSNMFQGNLSAGEIEELCEKDPKNSLCLELSGQEIDALKKCDYTVEGLETLALRPRLTEEQMEMIKKCLEQIEKEEAVLIDTGSLIDSIDKEETATLDTGADLADNLGDGETATLDPIDLVTPNQEETATVDLMDTSTTDKETATLDPIDLVTPNQEETATVDSMDTSTADKEENVLKD